MSLAFIGYVVDDDTLKKGRYSLADNKMQQNYMIALSLIDSSLFVLSSSNPSPGRLFKKSSQSTIGGVEVFHPFQLVVPIVKQILLFCSLSIRLFVWALNNRKEKKILVYYNTFLSYSLLAIFAKIILNIKVVPIAITRPYHYRCKPHFFDRLQEYISKECYKRIDGIIAITEPLAKLVNHKVPKCIICGGVDRIDEEKIEKSHKSNNRQGAFKIVYTGTLYSRYHIREILEAMNMLPKKKFELHVYGQGELADMVRSFSVENKDIIYHGVVDRCRLKSAQSEAGVLLSVLDTEDSLARYSFPSKIFEYMETGRMIIASNLLTYPKGMADHLIILNDLTADSIAEAIKAASSATISEQTNISNRMINYLNTNHTWPIVSARLGVFFNAIEGKK